MSARAIRLRALALSLLAGGSVAACATPGPVRDLTEKTGANVSFVSTQLRRLAQDSRRLADGRAGNAARLHAQTTNLKLGLEADTEILRKVDNARVSKVRELQEFAGRIIQSHAESAKAETDRRTRIVAGQHALEAPGSQLSTVASGLAALAKEDEPRARLEFLAGFVQTVGKEVEDRQKDKQAATKAAEAGIDKGVAPGGGGN